MNAKIKHSKIKNTGILFELLARQITVDVLNNQDGKAVNMLKAYFSPKKELGKEYQLYKILTTEKYKSKSKANHLVSAVMSASRKINKMKNLFESAKVEQGRAVFSFCCLLKGNMPRLLHIL